MEADQFTLSEANALIPWLSERFRTLNIHRQEYNTIREQISNLQITSGDANGAARLKAVAEELSRQTEEGVEEILDRGIIVRDVTLGLVDFPSLRDKRDIYLCWIVGDKQVNYWHEIDQGFSHRQPI